VILPADRDAAQRPLDPVRVQRNLRVVEEPHESQPQAARVRPRYGVVLHLFKST
jgi:hypothetical protein